MTKSTKYYRVHNVHSEKAGHPVIWKASLLEGTSINDPYAIMLLENAYDESKEMFLQELKDQKLINLN